MQGTSGSVSGHLKHGQDLLTATSKNELSVHQLLMGDYEIDEQPEVQESMSDMIRQTREMDVDKDDMEVQKTPVENKTPTPNDPKK